MPYPATQNPTVWNSIDDDGFDQVYFNCPWTITTNNESITVKITYLKWTFRYDYWIRVKNQPQENSDASQLFDKTELPSLFKSLATALLNYYELPQRHLKEFQLLVIGEFLDHLSYKVN